MLYSAWCNSDFVGCKVKTESYICLNYFFLAIASAEGYAPKMEDWGSVNRATFPSAHGVNGIDKSVIDADIKYPQVPYYKLVFYNSDDFGCHKLSFMLLCNYTV